MPVKVSTEDFIACWNRHQSPKAVADELGLSVRAVYERRQRIEVSRGIVLATVEKHLVRAMDPQRQRQQDLAEKRFTHLEMEADFALEHGTAIVFSDAHYWPGEPTTAHRALVKVIEQLKPALIVANGDIFDGARISRHPRGFEVLPTVREEVEVVCKRMAEIERAAGDATLMRTLGNHDHRLESYIALNAPELDGLHGTSLFDFLPRWRGSYTLHINRGDEGWTVIRHVHVAGGIHSAYNSTVRAGTHYVHGHLHKLQVIPYGDYRGRRYGVDTGTLAEPSGGQFRYTQGGPLNWCSGFAVLTYRNGRLLIPELVEIIDGKAWFRGDKVSL